MKKNKYFLIGIKGAGMTSLARVLKQSGYEVTGSDLNEEMHTQIYLDLDKINYFDFDEFDFDESYTVIVGNSFSETFSEVLKARSQNNQVIWYYEFLGQLSMQIPSIAVTGTHGKTSTTTLLSNALSSLTKIAFLIGDGNGGSCENYKYFVFEACEYRNNFHKYFPKHAIITNVSHDHRDFFETQEMYDDSFLKFSENVLENIIVCADDEAAYELFKNNDKTVFYGINKDVFVTAKNVVFHDNGTNFDLYIDNKFISNYSTKLFGNHNLLNYLAVITVIYLEGFDIYKLIDSYDGFMNPRRRFEEFIYEEQIIIDDYAHHPEELNAFLNSVIQKYGNKKIISVFEPHTIARLEEHYQAFAKLLNKTDKQIIHKVKIPLRDLTNLDDNHIESDIMLPYLINGCMYSDEVMNLVMKERDCVVIFIGPTIFEYTNRYLQSVNLIFNKK